MNIKMERKKDREFAKISWTWVVGTTFVVLSFVFLFFNIIPLSFEETCLGRFVENIGFSEYIEILGIHYTTVFLTTSLMSTLGESADYVYYEDIIDRTLLEPNGFDFHSLSVYSFLTIGISTVAVVVRSPYVFLASFVAGIITITFLFFKMVRIYFKRSCWEKKIFNEMTSEKNELSQYIENIQRLRYVINDNIENKEKDKIVLNLAFIIELLSFFSSTNPKNNSLSKDKSREYEKKYKSVNALYVETVGKIRQAENRNAVLDYLLLVIALLKKKNKSDAITEVADRIIGCLMDNSKNEISDEQFEMIRICHRDSLETVVKQKEELLFGIIEKIDNEKWSEVYEGEMIEVRSLDLMHHLLPEVDEMDDIESISPVFSCGAYNYGCEAIQLLKVRTFPKFEIVYTKFNDDVPVQAIYQVIEKFLEKDEIVINSGYSISNKKRGFEEKYSGLFSERLPRILYEQTPEDTIFLIESLYLAYKYSLYDSEQYEFDGCIGCAPIKYNGRVKKNAYETICISMFRGVAEIINVYKKIEYIDNLVGIIGNFFESVSFYLEDIDKCEEFYENALELIGLKFTDVYVREGTFSYVVSELGKSDLDSFKEKMTRECMENLPMLYVGNHRNLKGFDKDMVFRKFDKLFE